MKKVKGVNIKHNQDNRKMKGLVLGLFLLISCSAFSQIEPPGGEDGNVNDEAPIDGFVGMIALAGGLYGAKKLRKNKKS